MIAFCEAEATLEQASFVDHVLPGSVRPVGLLVFRRHDYERDCGVIQHLGEPGDIGDARHRHPIEFIPGQL